MRNFTVLAVLALVIGSSASGAWGTIIPTTPDGDGMAGRDWYSNPNSYWVDNTSTTIQVNHDGGNRWLYRGIAIIDISSLAGQALDAGSTSFNFYSFGFSGVQLQFLSNSADTVTTGVASSGGSYIADLPGDEGWKSYDVTSLVQSAIDAGSSHVGFLFNATVNYGGGSAASFEDGRGAYLNMAPEPATLALLGLGLAGLVARRRALRS